MKNKKVIAGTVIVTASLITFSVLISMIDFGEVDRKDYAKVGETFIRESGFIANKIGKVTRISHFGKGGRSGKESNNVYKVRGTDDTGICTLVISRDSNDDWYVTSADIAFSGKTLTVPIKRSEGEKVKKFDMN
ncbi:hypothetical protein ACFL50_02550 [Candidatus Latescibacterota bacterium]